MIDQSINMFLKYNFQEKVHEKLFPFLFEYVDYVLPVLIKGKHTADNEIECCASQYLHLSYRKTKDSDVNFIVYRNEQNTGLLLKVSKDKYSYEVSAYLIAQPLSKSINSKTLKDLRWKVGENYDRLFKKASTLKEFESSPESFDNPIFTLRKWSLGQERISVEARSPYYTFEDQLKVFDTMNAMVCGVSSHLEESLPKSFNNHFSATEEMISKLKKALE